MWKNLHDQLPQLRGKIQPHIKGITQSTSAQAFNLLGIIAGSILAESYGIFQEHPWALLVFPGLLSNRGAIGGLFSGRLSTGLHLGTIRPQIRGNTREAQYLLSSVITLTLLSAILLTLSIGTFSIITLKIDLTELIQLTTAIFATLALSILVISPTTFLVSIQAFNRGLDPDMVVYPITSTTADVSISIIYITILKLITINTPLTNLTLLLITATFITIATLIHTKNREEPEYKKTIKEFTGTLLTVTAIVTLTGYMLARISTKIGARPEIYAIYPAMIDTVGDVGSIIGSTATTKLSLGYFKPQLSSIRQHLNEITYAWTGSLLLFTTYALISATAYGPTSLTKLLTIVWWTNLITIPIIAAITFTTGITTFNHGLDPDNFVIPFETSLADSLTTIILYLIITLTT
jgi:mgtE-like transporter